MKLKRIAKPADLLMMPVRSEGVMTPTEMELQNLYGYVAWLQERIEQLESHLNKGEPL